MTAKTIQTNTDNFLATCRKKGDNEWTYLHSMMIGWVSLEKDCELPFDTTRIAERMDEITHNPKQITE